MKKSVEEYFENLNQIKDGFSDNFFNAFKKITNKDFQELDEDTQLLVAQSFDLGRQALGNFTVDFITDPVTQQTETVVNYGFLKNVDEHEW